MIDTQESLLQHNSFRLQLNSVQKVTKLELDSSDVSDASRHLLIHGTSHLHQHINTLLVQLKCSFKLILFVESTGLKKACPHIRMQVSDLLDISVEFANVTCLERQVLVVRQDSLFCQGCCLGL